jgi:hypothetical protein
MILGSGGDDKNDKMVKMAEMEAADDGNRW